MKITTNPENWTGEEVSVMVNQKTKSFNFYGYEVELELTESHRGEHDELNVDFYDIMLDGNKTGVISHEIYTPCQTELITAYNDDMDGLNRNGDSIYSAAVKMLSNVL